ncbi:hypothetical protein WHW08_28345 [Klebsiella pneumoniae]
MVFFIFKPAVQTEENSAEQKQESAGISFITLLKTSGAVAVCLFYRAAYRADPGHCLGIVYGEPLCLGQRGGRFFRSAGLAITPFQAVVAGALAKRLSEKTIIFAGFIADATAFLLMSAITSGWMVYPVPILLAGGGIALPALQGIISAGASAANQGKTTGCAGQPDQSDRRGGPAAVCFYFQSDTAECGRYGVADWHGTVRSAAGTCLLIRKPAPVAATC